MMRTFLIFLALAGGQYAWAQKAPPRPFPEKLTQLPRELWVHHFPSPVHASLDPARKDYTYFWKHTTSVLSPREPVEVIEFGAYIYYQARWNLRTSFAPGPFARWFDCSKALLKAGQPYTYKDNWRTDNRLQGGWALWYVIGQKADGTRVVGYEALETTDQLFPQP